MKDKRPDNSLDRRSFMRLAGLGATAGAATVLAGATDAIASPKEKPASTGYRETAHVKRYYELAKF